MMMTLAYLRDARPHAAVFTVSSCNTRPDPDEFCSQGFKRPEISSQ